MKNRLLALLILLTIAQAASSQSWPTYKGDNTRGGWNAAKSRCDLTQLGVLWNYTTGDKVKSSPAMADINWDGMKEVVVGSDDGKIYVISHEGRSLWQYQTGGAVRSSPTLSDIDGDNRTEVIVGSDDGILYVLDENGQPKWTYQTGGPIRGSPAAEDMDRNRGMEIIFGSYDERVYCLNNMGKKLWDYKTADAIDASPAIYDVNGDREYEVIIGSNDNIVYVLKHPPYKVWTYTTNGDVSATPSIDKSGKILVGSEDKSIYRLEIKNVGTAETRRTKLETGWGSETIGLSGIGPIWNYTTHGPVKSSPSGGDINGTNTYVIVCGSGDDTFYILNPSDGTLNRTYTVSKPIRTGTAIADLNGDNVTEMIFGADDGRLYVIDYPGVKKYSLQTGGPVVSSPAVSDFTGDKDLEIVFGSDDGNVYAVGDLRAAEIGKGDVRYYEALRHYGAGEKDRTTEKLNEAIMLYEAVNHTDGVTKAKNFFQRMDADVILEKARSLYLDGSLTSASEEVQKAALVYADILDNQSLGNAEILYRRVEADIYYNEAVYYLSHGLQYNASVYLESARTFYRSVNDTEGLKRVNNLSTISRSSDKAETYFEDGLKAMDAGEFEKAKMHFGFAKQSYELAGNKDGLKRTQDKLASVDAEQTYATAQKYYDEGDYDKATEVLKRAVVMYGNTSNEKRQKVVRFYSRIEGSRKADGLLEEAKVYYSSAFYKAAMDNAMNAARVYNQSDNYDGFEKAQRLFLTAKDAQETASSGPIMWPTIVKITAVALAMVVAAFTLKRYNEEKLRRLQMMRMRRPWQKTPTAMPRPAPPMPPPKPLIVINATGFKNRIMRMLGKQPLPTPQPRPAIPAKPQPTPQRPQPTALEPRPQTIPPRPQPMHVPQKPLQKPQPAPQPIQAAPKGLTGLRRRIWWMFATGGRPPAPTPGTKPQPTPATRPVPQPQPMPQKPAPQQIQKPQPTPTPQKPTTPPPAKPQPTPAPQKPTTPPAAKPQPTPAPQKPTTPPAAKPQPTPAPQKPITPPRKKFDITEMRTKLWWMLAAGRKPPTPKPGTKPQPTPATRPVPQPQPMPQKPAPQQIQKPQPTPTPQKPTTPPTPKPQPTPQKPTTPPPAKPQPTPAPQKPTTPPPKRFGMAEMRKTVWWMLAAGRKPPTPKAEPTTTPQPTVKPLPAPPQKPTITPQPTPQKATTPPAAKPQPTPAPQKPTTPPSGRLRLADRIKGLFQPKPKPGAAEKTQAPKVQPAPHTRETRKGMKHRIQLLPDEVKESLRKETAPAREKVEKPQEQKPQAKTPTTEKISLTIKNMLRTGKIRKHRVTLLPKVKNE